MTIAEIEDAKEFRGTLREWLPSVLEGDPERTDPQLGYTVRPKWWMARLREVGLATPHWPREYGGVEMDLFRRAILAEELARADAPSLDAFMVSLNHVPATLLDWGTEAQKRQYLPEVSQGMIWCQGFSEPGAGSDLAALSTRADKVGSEYVVNGQKIWSTVSMYAERCILLARTDPTASKHAGISFFVLDLATPGVEVRPIRQANGDAKFGEIFLSDVRIPAENLVGEENLGWTIAQTTLSAERGLFALEQIERLRFVMERHHRLALESTAAWLGDQQLMRSFVRLFAKMQSIRTMIRKLLFAAHGSIAQAQLPVYIKVQAALLRKDFGDFLVEASGPESQFCDVEYDPSECDPQLAYLTSFSSMIGGGTNEIMRNIIAERHLGMPRR